MLSAAQQMLQDSRTKIELLRMQMVKISQVKGGELDGAHGTSPQPASRQLHQTAYHIVVF